MKETEAEKFKIELDSVVDYYFAPGNTCTMYHWQQDLVDICKKVEDLIDAGREYLCTMKKNGPYTLPAYILNIHSESLKVRFFPICQI